MVVRVSKKDNVDMGIAYLFASGSSNISSTVEQAQC